MINWMERKTLQGEERKATRQMNKTNGKKRFVKHIFTFSYSVETLFYSPFFFFGAIGDTLQIYEMMLMQ